MLCHISRYVDIKNVADALNMDVDSHRGGKYGEVTTKILSNIILFI